MEINIEKLPESPELLQKIIVSLHQSLLQNQEELISYKTKYAYLIEQIRLAKQKRFSPSSEKDILQADIFDEAGVELPEEVKELIHDEADEVEMKGYVRKKHPIRRPLPKDLPREVILHDIPDSEKTCGCGSSLVRIGEEITEQLKYIPAKLCVVQHVRPKYACKPCQENVKIAAMPVLLLPKCIATPELVAHTIIAKYCDHLPLYRQESIWKRLDIDMPRSSLCGWLLKVAELCEPLVKLMQKHIVSYDYAQADETTVQVLDEVGRANKTKSYMWCYRGGGEKPSIVYEYQPTRGGYHAENFLGGFNGYLQTDAYSGYHFAERHKGIIRVGCMAHARRKFADIVKMTKTNGLGADAIKFFKALYKIEKDARENNLSSQDRFILREEKAGSILKAFKTWLDNHLTKTPVQSKIGEAIHYTLSNWEFLKNYLKDGRIEIDNNLLENAIRPFALGRKNWLFNGSPGGAKAGAIFYSLIETCKANNIEPYQYFCNMLHMIRLCKTDDDYRKLLPQAIRF